MILPVDKALWNAIKRFLDDMQGPAATQLKDRMEQQEQINRMYKLEFNDELRNDHSI